MILSMLYDKKNNEVNLPAQKDSVVVGSCLIISMKLTNISLKLESSFNLSDYTLQNNTLKQPELYTLNL